MLLELAKRWAAYEKWYENAPNKMPESELPPGAKEARVRKQAQLARDRAMFGDLLDEA